MATDYIAVSVATALLISWGGVMAVLLSNWSKKPDRDAYDFVADLRRSDAVMTFQMQSTLDDAAKSSRAAAESSRQAFERLDELIGLDVEKEAEEDDEEAWLRELAGVGKK